MTSRERLLALLRGKPTDRIGVQVRGVLPWSAAWCAARDDSFRPLIDAVAEHADWEAMCGFDTGFFCSAARPETLTAVRDVPGNEEVEHHVTTIHTGHGPLQQVVARSRVGHPPMTVEHFVKTPEDAEAVLGLPYAPAQPALDELIELDRAVGQRGLVLVILGADPIGDVHELLGTELLAFWSRSQRPLLHRMMEEFLRRKLDLLDYLAAERLGERMPLWIGHVGAEIAVPPLHGPDDFRDFVVRYDTPLHEKIHAMGGYVHVHSHGSIRLLLEDFAEMGTDMLHPVEAPPLGDTPLGEAKRRIGDRVTIEGNVEISRLLDEEPAAFRKRIRRTVAEGKPGGRFVLCPTASPYPVKLSERAVANYLTMIELGLDEGRY